MRSPASLALPAWLLPIFGLGATLALGGGLWDDAWHTERGRDTFFIAPHLAIYGGVSLIGAGISLWLALAARAEGLRAALRSPVIGLAAASVAVTLTSAPVDNFWHVAFGRDAVIWSPPHVLGIVGTGSLAVAVLVALAGPERPWMRRLQGPVGGLLLAAFAFVVVEYETDVPQFAPTWYLPVLGLAAGFVFAVIDRLSSERAPVTMAAVWHLVFVAAVGLLLTTGGFDAPRLPLLIVPAMVFDLLGRAGRGVLTRSALTALALFAAYVPTSHVGRGMGLGVNDVLVGLPLSWLAFGLTLAALSFRRGRPLRPGSLMPAAAVFLLLVLPATALAHDPGQGSDAGTLSLRVASTKGWAAVAVRAPADWSALGTTARRGGETHRAPLRETAPGRFSGQVALDSPGRWFVYVQLRRPDRKTVEAWIPVARGETVTEAHRFAYLVDRKPSSTVKWLIGAVLYLVVLGFLAAVVAMVRRTPQVRPI